MIHLRRILDVSAEGRARWRLSSSIIISRIGSRSCRPDAQAFGVEVQQVRSFPWANLCLYLIDR